MTQSRHIEESFPPAALAALVPPEPSLPAASDVPVAKPWDGAANNSWGVSSRADVAKWDPSGLRNTMTANEPAYLRELATHGQNHLPQPWWTKRGPAADLRLAAAKGVQPQAPGLPGVGKRLTPWRYTQDKDW